MQSGTSIAHSMLLKQLSLPKQETSNPMAPINNFALKKSILKKHYFARKISTDFQHANGSISNQ
jgi:hypothetical protein